MILGVFDHVTIRVSDLAASRAFYELLLGPPSNDGEYVEWDDFGIAPGEPSRHLHVGFVAGSRDEVDATWQRLVDAGYERDGDPGPRPQYGPEYYGGFLLDPDGNSAEAVHNDSLREGGAGDHLWLCVAGVAAAKRYYEALAPYARSPPQADLPQRAQFLGDTG